MILAEDLSAFWGNCLATRGVIGLTNPSPFAFNLLEMDGSGDLANNLELIIDEEVQSAASEPENVSLLTEVLSLAILSVAFGTVVLIAMSFKLVLIISARVKLRGHA